MDNSMTNRYLAFDLETAKITTPDADLDAQRPLGIACAAAWAADSATPFVWCGHSRYGRISPSMNADEVNDMLRYLKTATYNGYTLLTFNGAGFDLKTVAELGDLAVCKNLAMTHVDMFFHLFCKLGYGPGFGRAAKGMGLPGKTEGMDGAFAPDLWARGEYGKVLQYVVQDARATLDLALAVEDAREVRWMSKTEKQMTIGIPKWLTVMEAMELPKPDTSWMRDAWTREKFVGWAL